jgi:hypothetical protein
MFAYRVLGLKISFRNFLRSLKNGESTGQPFLGALQGLECYPMKERTFLTIEEDHNILERGGNTMRSELFTL